MVSGNNTQEIQYKLQYCKYFKLIILRIYIGSACFYSNILYCLRPIYHVHPKTKSLTIVFNILIHY